MQRRFERIFFGPLNTQLGFTSDDDDASTNHNADTNEHLTANNFGKYKISD
jgi:hypothetical protein